MQVFKRAWWLPSAHLQTLWPVLFRQHPALDLLPERFELADGDFIDLAWGRHRERPVVLVLHGLEGSIESHYARGLMKKLEQNGFCPVFMHFRGCSGEPNRLPRSYHSGDTGDMAAVVEHIAAETGKPVFAAVGFSLGGNALLKWLGQTGAANPLKRAVAVSVPFVLADAAKRLEKGVSRIYEQHLIKSLRRAYREKFQHRPSPLNVNVNRLRSFWDYDNEVTAPLHGFDGVEHYYNDSSSRKYLSGIEVPTRIIHAKDDPFMFPATVPGKEELSNKVELLLTDNGGHVGFIVGQYPWKPVYWHEEAIVEFLLV